MLSPSFRSPLLFLSLFTLLIAPLCPARADYYTVRPGDNIDLIADRVGVSLKALHRANPNADVIQPGQKLRLPKDGSDAASDSRSASKSDTSPSRSKSAKAKRLKAQLAEWTAYKKAAARQASRHAAKSKRLKRQLAEWKAYKQEVTRKKHLAATKKQRLLEAKRERLMAKSSVSHRKSALSSAKAARHRARLLAQLAEWKAHKKKVARLSQKKRHQQLAWENHLQRLDNKKHLARLAAKQRARRRLVAEAQHPRGSYRRSMSETRKMLRTGNGSSRSESSQQVASAGNFENRVVRTALSYRGTRYVYGASGGGAFDCSGFTRHVLSRVEGVNLPHSSREQYGYGSKVSRDNLKAGDLLFFHTNRSGISHVGIYIGNGKFVHAANPRRGVTTDSVGGSYYANRLVGARRIRK